MDMQFVIADALTGEERGTLHPISYSFNDPLWGAGQLEMVVSLPKAYSKIQSLRTLTEIDRTAVYVVLEGQVLFSGPINYRSYTPGSTTVVLRAQSWRAWFYTRVYPSRLYKNNYDQYRIVYDLLDFATSHIAAPTFLRPTALSGVLREFTVEPGWSVGKALDSFGSRDGGFEWYVGAQKGAVEWQYDRLVELYAEGESRSESVLLDLDATATKNYVAVGSFEEDGSPRRTRVWGVGDGTWPDVKVVSDSDPNLASGGVLLREEWMSWSGVIDSVTLFDHARAERLVRSQPVVALDVTHIADKPSILNYRVGDRARLRMLDAWLDIDQSGIRIVDRAISKAETGLLTATVSLDLLDVREDLA